MSVSEEMIQQDLAELQEQLHPSEFEGLKQTILAIIREYREKAIANLLSDLRKELSDSAFLVLLERIRALMLQHGVELRQKQFKEGMTAYQLVINALKQIEAAEEENLSPPEQDKEDLSPPEQGRYGAAIATVKVQVAVDVSQPRKRFWQVQSLGCRICQGMELHTCCCPPYIWPAQGNYWYSQPWAW